MTLKLLLHSRGSCDFGVDEVTLTALLQKCGILNGKRAYPRLLLWSLSKIKSILPFTAIQSSKRSGRYDPLFQKIQIFRFKPSWCSLVLHCFLESYGKISRRHQREIHRTRQRASKIYRRTQAVMAELFRRWSHDSGSILAFYAHGTTRIFDYLPRGRNFLKISRTGNTCHRFRTILWFYAKRDFQQRFRPRIRFGPTRYVFTPSLVRSSKPGCKKKNSWVFFFCMNFSHVT